MNTSIDDWLAELGAALDVPAEVIDVDALLHLARDAAHGIARPAAPLTALMVGLAAGLRGGSAADLRACCAIAGEALDRRSTTGESDPIR